MIEPNLQNIPNDYEIQTMDHPSAHSSASAPNSSFDDNLFSPEKPKPSDENDKSSTTTTTMSLRHAFVAFEGGVLLAVDYSQLELRIIAHLADDAVLLDILNGEGDVFRSIAGSWLHVAPADVPDEKRTWAKRVCYGMIYGIGAHSLAQQLGINEEEAAQFMNSFLDNYQGLKRFLSQTLVEARKDGFVTTLAGRKRFLADIADSNPHKKSHAERQAVNTRVQGSAADLVKRAMINVEKRLEEEFPECRTPHRGAPEDLEARTKRLTGKEELGTTKALTKRRSLPPRGAYLVLQLHDELIYEVNVGDLQRVARIIKTEMENAWPGLKVKFPVKLKTAKSWSAMKDLDLG